MPAYKLDQLGAMVESILFEEWLQGNNNWIPDYKIKVLGYNKHGILEKEDTWRRVADDVAKMGKIKKLRRKALYKHIYCSDTEL